MNDPIDFRPGASPDPSGKTPTELASLRQLTLIIYALYALSWLAGVTAIIAVVINYVKREDTAGTIYESHFRWQIRTFWWGLFWFVLGALTMVFMVGFAIFFVATVWVIYRLVKGFLYWNERKPLPL
ncbi:predicted membrane protein [Serpentinimonas raichei]|uniref:Predicted membrane protein n=1 Tax=Serpentinimonas raichei TaxID=1458425 RepID=A0A060NHQ9_9BURK|nr:hypothetical protein [Serpentinimonas raichei]BAO81486.1 predicted membrane protein [Serpentinimonas raichei]